MKVLEAYPSQRELLEKLRPLESYLNREQYGVVDSNLAYQREKNLRAVAERPIRLDLVIPTLNEAHVLQQSISRLIDFLDQRIVHDWRVIVADNGSTDGTLQLAREIAEADPRVVAFHIERPGRGQALRRAWSSSDADVVCYMDVDLSTDLEAIPEVVAAVTEQGFDLAVGSRLLPESCVTRSLKREFISRAYNFILRTVLRSRFSDAQCGFKALSRTAVERIIPLVEDDAWFFDTELLVLAERLGYKIKDTPVKWVEDSDSRVKILKTAQQDIAGIVRLRRNLRKLGL